MSRLVGVGKSHRKDQDREEASPEPARPGRTTRTAELDAIEPGESLHIAASQLEQIRTIDVPALETAIRERSVLVPHAVVAIRERLWLAEQSMRSASLRGARRAEVERVRGLAADVAPRVRQLLADHDRLATSAANTAAIDRWLAADLERRETVANDSMPLGVVTGVGPARAQVPTTQPAPRPTIDAARKSREITIDLAGNAAYQASFVITQSWGSTGIGGQVGPDDNELKALELTASTKLNRLSAKLSAAALNDEANLAQLAPGLSVNVELNIAEASLDRVTKETDLDPINVAIKLVGDVTHWLGAPKDLTLTLDGRITISLKNAVRSLLVRRVRKFMAAQLAERMLARRLDMVGPRLEAEKRAYDDLLERKKGLVRGTPEAELELRKIQQELAERKRALRKTAEETRDLAHRLGQARRRSQAALAKMKNGLAKKLAKVLAKRTAQVVMKAVLKLIPGLNVISAIIDVVEIISLLRNLDWDGGRGPSTGSSPGGDGPPDATGGSDPGSSGPATNPDQVDQPANPDGSGRAGKPGSGSTDGPVTTPGPPTQEPGAAGEGPDRGGSSRGSDTKGAADPHDGSFEGPITDPDQLKNVNDPRVIVEEFPIAIAAKWFQVENGQLVMTEVGKSWIERHRRKPIDESSTLQHAAASITKQADQWILEMTFRVKTGPAIREFLHSFFVKARGGILVFEPFMMAGSAHR